MTVDKYNYTDKGELRNRIRELEEKWSATWQALINKATARAEKAESLNQADEKRIADLLDTQNLLNTQAAAREARVAELETEMKRIRELEAELTTRGRSEEEYDAQARLLTRQRLRAEKAEARVAELEAMFPKIGFAVLREREAE